MKTLRILSFLLLAPSLHLVAGDLSAEQILDKAAAALGDPAVIAKQKTYAMYGRMEMKAQGIKGTIEAKVKDGGKLNIKTVMKAPGVNMEMQQGCNGEDCFSNDPMMGLRKLEGQEKETMMLQNDILSATDWKAMYKTWELEGKEALDGKAPYKINLMTKADMPITAWYDAKSFLLWKTEMVTSSPMGQMRMVIFHEDYQLVGGVMNLAKTMRIKSLGGVESFMYIDEVEFNLPLPDSTFALPPGLE